MPWRLRRDGFPLWTRQSLLLRTYLAQCNVVCYHVWLKKTKKLKWPYLTLGCESQCPFVCLCPCIPQNNGGCSKYGRCSYLGNGQRNCTCRMGYIGDGINCRGSTYQVSHMAFADFLLSYDLWLCCSFLKPSLCCRKSNGSRRTDTSAICTRWVIL